MDIEPIQHVSLPLVGSGLLLSSVMYTSPAWTHRVMVTVEGTQIDPTSGCVLTDAVTGGAPPATSSLTPSLKVSSPRPRSCPGLGYDLVSLLDSVLADADPDLVYDRQKASTRISKKCGSMLLLLRFFRSREVAIRVVSTRRGAMEA